MLSPWRESWRRRAAWFALILGVLLAHALFGLRVLSSAIGWNSAPAPKRIEVTFSKRVAPTAPPTTGVALSAPAPAPAPRALRPVRSASVSPVPSSASAPAEAGFRRAPDVAPSESRAQLVGQALALAADLERAQRAREAAESASAAQARAVEIAAAAASAAQEVRATAAIAGPARPPFDWPPATRLTYTLTGERGTGVKIYGHATVEWRHEGRATRCSSTSTSRR